MFLDKIIQWPSWKRVGSLRVTADRSRSPRAVREISKSLDALVRNLSESVGSTEQDFVLLGHELRSLYSRATELTSMVRERANGLREALEKNHWTTGGGLASGVITEVHRSMEDASGLLSSLEQVGHALSDLDARARAVQRIGVYLRSSVVGFAIESSRSVECQHSFSSFVSELRGLSGSVGQVVDEITRDVRTARETQKQSQKKLAEALRGIRQVSRELETAAKSTADEARLLLERSLAAFQEAEQRAGAITVHADASVYHLQFGDIVRQKMEHVLDALRQASVMLSGPSQGNEQLRGVEQTLKIQVHQLEAVLEEVAKTRETLRAAFQGIAGETRSLAQALGKSSDGPGSADGAETLRAFVEDCRWMSALRKESSNVGSEARASAAAAVENAVRLTQHFKKLSAINFEMHLQALNAIVKTAALGSQGVTLEVLSTQVDRLYRDSNAEVIIILEAVERFQSGAFANAGPAESEADFDTSDANADGDLQRVIDAFQDFTKTAAQAEGMAREEEQCLQHSESAIEFLQEIAANLKNFTDDLRALREQLAVWTRTDQTPVTTPAVVSADSYTMQSERDVHARVIGSLHEKARGIQPTLNVESIPFESTPTSNVEASPNPDPLPLEVACAEPTPAPEKKPAAGQPVALASVEQQSFGDNVELF